MGSAKINLGFVKYGFGICHIWAGFITYGVSKDTFGFCQIWVWDLSHMGGFCHIWGQQRYIWVLSNMGLGFVIYGCFFLLHMGSAKIHLGFVKYGLGICQIWGAQKGQSASIT